MPKPKDVFDSPYNIYETVQDTTVTFYNCFEERLKPHASCATTTPKPDTLNEPGNVKKVLRSIGERLTKI